MLKIDTINKTCKSTPLKVKDIRSKGLIKASLDSDKLHCLFEDSEIRRCD